MATIVPSSQPRISFGTALKPIDTKSAPVVEVREISPGGSQDGVTAPSDVAPPVQLPPGVPAGFTDSGDLKAFGLIPAKLYSFSNKVSGLHEVVPLGSPNLSIASILPSFKDNALNGLVLQNTRLIYNDKTTDVGPAGTWLVTDLSFQREMGVVSDVLQNHFHQGNPVIHAQALLSPNHDWSKPPRPSTVNFQGSLPGASATIGDHVKLTSLGFSFTTGNADATDVAASAWTFSLTGSALFTLASGADSFAQAPTILDYSLSYVSKTLQLHLTSNATTVLSNFGGVTGLSLSNLSLSTELAPTAATAKLNFDMKAQLQLLNSTVSLTGHYGADDWNITSVLKNLDLVSLGQLYQDLFGHALHKPDYDLNIENVTLVIGHHQLQGADDKSVLGISLNAKVTIGEYTSATATVLLDRLGLTITGAVNDIVLNKHMSIQSAKLNLYVGRTSDTTAAGPGTSWRFAIEGVFKLSTPDLGKKFPALDGNLQVDLFLAKDSKGVLQWLLFGQLALGAPGTTPSLGDIASELKSKDSKWLGDLPLEGAAIIASSSDGLVIPDANIPSFYKIIKGIQVAAAIHGIRQFDQAMHLDNTQLVLSAAYDADTAAFELDFMFRVGQPTFNAHSGNIQSDPKAELSLMIRSNPVPTLIVNGEFSVKAPKQDGYIPFVGGFKITPASADLYAGIRPGFIWNNPFGLSPKLSLGPIVTLDVGVDLPPVIFPSSAGIAAGLIIGNTSGQAAISLGEQPDQELLSLQIHNLKIADLIDFAAKLFDQSISNQNDDFLEFKDFEIYISGGVTLGTQVYPAGAKFKCVADLFGKNATIDVEVDKAKKAIVVQGSIEPFELGPLTVTAAQGTGGASVDIALGTSDQHIIINGAFKLLDVSASLYLKTALLDDKGAPAKSFQLDAKLAFMDHLEFDLMAANKAGVPTNLKALKNVQFDIDFFFKQDILDCIITHVHESIKAAKDKAQSSLDEATKKLDDAKKQYQADLDKASAALEAKRKEIQGKIDQASAALTAKQQELDSKKAQLQAAFDAANAKFQHLCATLEQNVRDTEARGLASISSAQAKVDSEKRRTDNDINVHLAQLAKAQDDMARSFGDAIAKLQAAQNEVNRTHGVADGALRDLNNAKNDLSNCHWYDKPKYAAIVAAKATEYAACQAAAATADGVLRACQAVVSGPGYAAAKAAIDTYRAGVDVAKAAANAAMTAANGALDGAKGAANVANAAAQDALHRAQTSSQELADSKVAQSALNTFIASIDSILSGFKKAVTDASSAFTSAAFTVLQDAVKAAGNATSAIDLAKKTIQGVELVAEDALDLGDWLVSHAGHLLDIKQVHITGSLDGLASKSNKLTADFDAIIAEKSVKFKLDFTPGGGEDLAKDCFNKVVSAVKDGTISLPKRIFH